MSSITAHRRARAAPFLAVAFTAFTAITALSVPAQQAPPRNPCATPAHRQFDFWLGEWEVRTASDKVAGTSRVTRILGGCALREEWHGAGGGIGESLNIFDGSSGRWHQTWVDNQGLLAEFDGGVTAGGDMVLEGAARGPNGQPARGRMTFTPLPDGRVHQHWEQSVDSGVTWRTTFDGYYARRR